MDIMELWKGIAWVLDDLFLLYLYIVYIYIIYIYIKYINIKQLPQPKTMTCYVHNSIIP